MKNYLFKKVLLLLGFFATAIMSGQTITGTVSDASGPLPGANVFVKNTGNGTTTDFDGKYTLEGVANDAVVVVSFLGYTTQEIIAAGRNEIDVVLQEDLASLEEVVVIGYGTKKKSLVTGAISSVTSEEFQDVSVQRVEQVLQGRAAGVTVSSASGSPGSGAKIRIRGTGSNGNADPLYIVDGVKVNTIDNIIPSDIENVEVLKDAASSAIYGTEGANGVVIITTKKGKVGKSTISINSQVGYESYRGDMELMNAGQFVEYMNEAGFANVVDNGVNTNWLDEIFVNGLYQRHDVSFSGATEKTSYYLSGSMLDQDGIMVGGSSGFNRYSFRTNVTSDVKDWLQVGANVTYTNSKNDRITENDAFAGVIQNALILDPLTPVFYADGELPGDSVINGSDGLGVPLITNGSGRIYGYPEYSTGEVINPVARAAELNNNLEEIDYFLGSAFAKFKLFKGFEFTTRLGIERKNLASSVLTVPYFVSSEASNGSYGLVEQSQLDSKWLWENFATYNFELGKNNFTLLAGYSAEENVFKGIAAAANVGVDDFTSPYLDFFDNTEGTVGGYFAKNNLNSVFGRFSYNFDERYLFEATLRYDTTSLVAEEFKSEAFPSFSAGWVVSNEDFWSDDMPLNYFKLRGSWGQNGSVNNLDGGADQFNLVNSIGGRIVTVEGLTGLEVANIPNEALLWETSEQTDIGLDLRAFNNRLTFGFDWYKKTTKDLIVDNGSLISPLSAGLEIQEFNAGTVENTGLEFELGWQDQTDSGFSYGINLNISTLKNEVTELEGLPDDAFLPGYSIPTGPAITRFEEGEPIWYFYGYETAGIDEATGFLNIVDRNDDGVIDDNDKTNIGSPHPDLLFGANLNVGYKGVDLNVIVQGVTGNEIYAGYHQNSRLVSNKPVHWYEDRWTPTNTNASFPSAEYYAFDGDDSNPSGVAGFYESDLVVEDGSYLRVKQIQLGYNVPAQFLENFKISKLRVYVSLDDYFTFTKYKGLDPEIGGFDDNSINVDRGFYPVSGKLLMGLNLQF